jgi:hypothetical protein
MSADGIKESPREEAFDELQEQSHFFSDIHELEVAATAEIFENEKKGLLLKLEEFKKGVEALGYEEEENEEEENEEEKEEEEEDEK